MSGNPRPVPIYSRMSIRLKILCAMFISSLAVTGAVSQFAIWQQETIIKQNVESTGRFIVESLSDHIAELLAQSQYMEIREILNSVQKKDARIALIAVNDVTTQKNELIASVGDAEWIAATQDIFADRISALNGVDHYFFFKPIQIRGVEKPLGTIRIGMSLSFMEELLDGTRETMLSIMAIAVAVSLLLAVFISNYLLDPLRKLTGGIMKIAGGDFSHRIPVKSMDETGVMASTFNRMTENLTILHEIAAILSEQAGPQEVLSGVLARLARDVSGKSGAVVFHGLAGEELVAGDADETSLFYLRKLHAAGKTDQSDHPAPMREPGRLCFAFFSEGEITGGIWIVRGAEATFDEIDERLLNGVANQLETTLSKLEFQYRAVTDAMTGLYNHRYFQQEIHRQIEHARRLGRSFTLVMADIDHFKKINDTYGHQQGDIVLRAVAGAIRKTIRGKIDMPARYGGEEFAILLPETPIEGAKIFAERFRKAVEELSFDFNGKTVQCTISIGIATYPDASEDKRELIEAADRALYRAKEEGRNRTKTYKDL